MKAPNRICLLGFGEVGSRLALDLKATSGLELCAWDLQFNIPASIPGANLNRLNHVTPCKSADDAASECDLVISAVTAAQDLDAARSVLPGMAKGSWFLDLNSASPGTRQAVFEAVESKGGKYVEAAIMSPIDPMGMASPVLLGGPHAQEFLPLAKGLGFTGAEFCSDRIGQAAATKLCRSVVIKGMEALLSEALLSARHYGVEERVIASLENLFPRPDWPQHARYMISRSVQHGVRRAEEMREAALTVREAGLEPLMSTACAERQEWAVQFVSALGHEELAPMLDAIKQRLKEQLHGNSNTGTPPHDH